VQPFVKTFSPETLNEGWILVEKKM